MAKDQKNDSSAIIVMGVSGSGKTSVGRALADRLGRPFYDGDDFHPQANIDKMTAGVPLDDADRAPWLDRLHGLIARALADGQSLIVACSALKQAYRDRLRGGLVDVVFVYLRGDFDLIRERLEARSGHYMQPGMLESQFEALEVPGDALVVDVDRPVNEIAVEIVSKI